MRPYISVLLLAASAAFAQQPAVESAGFSDQQILDIFNGISQHEAQLQPMLEQIRAGDWVAKGAPDAYIAQLETARQQAGAIKIDMSELVQHPDHMTDCIKALFRARAFHDVLGSLLGGVRRYQNPALADLIESVAAEDQAQLGRLEQYVLELATDKEQQFAVIDKEAQRCRATLSRQPAATPLRKP